MDMGFGFSFFDSFMFNVFPIIFFIMFGTILIMFFTGIIKQAKQKAYNKTQPVLTVDAKIVDKRTDYHTRRHNGANNHVHTHSYSYYFVTFEVTSGDRMEFRVNDAEYGMMVQGDSGKLTFQGSDFKGFERAR